MRKVLLWNYDWRFQKTSEVPTALPTDWEGVTLPHTWNAADGQDGGNDYWRGTAMYAKSFQRPALEDGERVILEFAGAAMGTEVWVNGQKAGSHEGGYSTFRLDVTDLLAEEDNLICVAVDNSKNDHVYPQKADFTFYGGLYRNVKLIIVPAVHFELLKDGGPGIKVTPTITGKDAYVDVEVWANGGSVRFVVAGQTSQAEIKDGYACATLLLKDVHLWDGVNDPYLYTATATLFEDGKERDQVSTQFGCRSFCMDPENGFFLNGRPYPLRGVSRHQDRAGAGSALTEEMHREDVDLICEMGANTVRLAHYQHDQYFYSLCDERGLIAWAEIPYISQHLPNGRENALSQMRELVVQCYNHPSIVCWGLSNEITVSGQVSGSLMENHRALNDLCHRLDTTRPTVMAHAFMLEQESPLIPLADLGSYNLYFGWYLGELEQNGSFLDEYHARFPDRVMGFSEYGADANPSYQSSCPERGDYTETYQCVYHEYLLRCIEERPWLWATHVWNMFDFAADGRDEGGKNGWNQKGLVTGDRKLKKDAFYLYKAAWSKNPFVHLCGRRYVDRAEDVTEVKAYSNCEEVSLYVDGVLFETRRGRRTFVFRVPIFGQHTIEAVSGEQRDQIHICRVEAPNTTYQFPGRKVVINWFDKDALRSDCFSLRDTLGDLSVHPEARLVVEEMMEMVHAQRGDVAREANGNPNLRRMMAGISLESLIKQAGDVITSEYALELNARLQNIRRPVAAAAK